MATLATGDEKILARAADAFLELLKKSSDLPDEAFCSISTYVENKRYGTAQLLRVYGKQFEDDEEVPRATLRSRLSSDEWSTPGRMSNETKREVNKLISDAHPLKSPLVEVSRA